MGHFELVVCSGLWSYLLKHGYFLMKCLTLLPETFKYQECFRKCLDFMTFYSRTFIGFKLYRFCEDRHSYYEFSYMIKLPCLTNSVTLKSFINSGSLQSPDPLFCEKPWASVEENGIVVPFRGKHSKTQECDSITWHCNV